MDSSGNNRYELLFMDDDISSDPLDNIVAKTKKQVKTTTATAAAGGATSQKPTNKQSADGVTKTQANKKQQNQAEKENKPFSINKNDASKKQNVGGVAAGGDKFNKQGGAGAGFGGGAAGGAPANANRKRTGPGGNAVGGFGGFPSAGGEPREGGSNSGGQQQGIRNVNFRQQNGETREQRNNRRNIRENGFNNNGGGGGGLANDGTPQQPRQFRDRDNRGTPRNRNFDGGNRGGKREFDRQSGSDRTGVKSIDKRDGAGAHNWGSVKEAIDDVNKNDTTEGVGSAGGEKAEESGNEQTEQAAPVEEETKELTLDEWKAQKQQRAKPIYNIRKAGEGEDTSQWKKMVVLTSNKKKDTESEDELEFDPAMYPQRVGRQQRVLDIQFNFNDGRRGGGGGGFGGRGRGRGPRPGGGIPPTGGPGGPNTDRPIGGRGGVGGGIGDGAGGGAGGGGGRGIGGGSGSFEGGPRGNAGITRGGGGAGKRNFGGDRQQNAAPKVNDERQFPTLG